jgi:hypothetical protein
MLAFTGPARRWEPKRLRLRIFAVAGRLVRSGRRLRLRLTPSGPNHRRSTHPVVGYRAGLSGLSNQRCGPWPTCQGSRSDHMRLGLDTADVARTIEHRGTA